MGVPTPERAGPTVRFVDATGNGSLDGFVAVQESQIGWPGHDATVVKRIVETTADGIGDDGRPRHIHVTDLVLAISPSGQREELAVHHVDIDPEDAEAARAVINAVLGGATSSSS